MSGRRLLISAAAIVVAGAAITMVALRASDEPRPGVTALVYGRTSPHDFRLKDSWIWRARQDGSHSVRLAPGHSPVISPDGRSIAYLQVKWTPRSVAEELRVMPVAGGRSRLLRRDQGGRGRLSEVVWRPDSRELAVSAPEGLLTVDPEDGDTAEVVPHLDERRGIGTISFSPDGKHILFDVSNRRGIDIFIVSSSGGTPRRLTRDGRSRNPVPGPDGIAFARFMPGGREDVWVMDEQGRRGRRLTNTRAGILPFAVSADGRRLLAFEPARHAGRLWAVDVQRGTASDLTGLVGDLFPQGFSRDGTQILAATGCGGIRGSAGMVQRISFTTGQERVLVRGPCRASWNA